MRLTTHVFLLILLTIGAIVGLFYYAQKQNSLGPSLSNNQRLSFRLSRIGTIIDNIPNLNLPDGLEKSQLYDPQVIDNIYFVKFLKSNINFPIDSSIQRSGILYAAQNDKDWKIFYEIKDLAPKSDISSFKNNPYELWKEGNNYHTLIVDTNGAGSGEGNAKIVSIDNISKKWLIEECFYYSLESFETLVSQLNLNSSILEGMKSNLKTENTYSLELYTFDQSSNKFKSTHGVVDGCTLFDIEVGQ